MIALLEELHPTWKKCCGIVNPTHVDDTEDGNHNKDDNDLTRERSIAYLEPKTIIDIRTTTEHKESITKVTERRSTSYMGEGVDNSVSKVD